MQISTCTNGVRGEVGGDNYSRHSKGEEGQLKNLTNLSNLILEKKNSKSEVEKFDLGTVFSIYYVLYKNNYTYPRNYIT